MDRSFLSKTGVIEASRKFVCVRLTTYEDKDENAYMKKLFRGRTGEVENTTFAILSPTGEKLTRAGRSPGWSFDDGDDMAAGMNKIAARYDEQPALAKSNPPLPKAASVRMGMNIAASDDRPLVILYAANEEALKTLEDKFTPVAWQEENLGRFIHATSTSADDLKPIRDAKAASGILIVQPETFGISGQTITQLPATADAAGIERELQTALDTYQSLGEPSVREHIRAGNRANVFWETKLPVTDSKEERARQRSRRGRDPR